LEQQSSHSKHQVTACLFGAAAVAHPPELIRLQVDCNQPANELWWIAPTAAAPDQRAGGVVMMFHVVLLVLLHSDHLFMFGCNVMANGAG
jgi:hypothetical protein